MSRMSDIDILLTEASAAGEAAGKRLRAAIDAVEMYNALGPVDANVGRLVSELRGAAADAYDAAVDLPVQLRHTLNAEPATPDVEVPPGRFAFGYDGRVIPAEEVHRMASTLTPGDVVFDHNIFDVVIPSGNASLALEPLEEVDMSKPIYSVDGKPFRNIPEGYADLGHTSEELPELPPPPTDFGVRLTYADGTGEDIDNIDSVQVVQKSTNTFPFGFIEVGADEVDQKADGTHIQHRAGFWDNEGVFTPFDSRDQPNPNGGW